MIGLTQPNEQESYPQQRTLPDNAEGDIRKYSQAWAYNDEASSSYKQ